MTKKSTASKLKTDAPAGPAIQVLDRKAASAKFVTVACNLPNGLALQFYKMVDTDELILGGGRRTVQIAQRDGEIRINGTAVRMGEMPRHRIVLGYALTKNVPKEQWDRWEKANQDSDVLRNRCIFAQPQMDDLEDIIRDNRETVSGLQPVDPNGDRRAKEIDDRLKIDENSAKPQEMEDDIEGDGE